MIFTKVSVKKYQNCDLNYMNVMIVKLLSETWNFVVFQSKIATEKAMQTFDCYASA